MIDLVLLAVVAISALLGLLRGFVGIVVGTLSWVLAGWATFRFGADAGLWLSGSAAPTMTHYVAGYALVFVAVMVVVAVLGMLIRAAVDATRLTGTDRSLGLGLGALRGALFACVLVLLMGFTPLPQEPAWRQSHLVPVLLPAADWMRTQLPDWSVPDMNVPAMELGKLPLAGDNGGLDEALSGPSLHGVVGRVLGQPAAGNGAGHDAEPAGALPANIDPAQARPELHDPVRAESSGQARPPSQ